MYRLTSQGVIAAAEEYNGLIESLNLEILSYKRDCVLMYTRLRERYVSINEPRG